MTGFFSGIIGSLVGSGIQAAVGGIPISEDASKALDVLRVGGLPIPPANWFSTNTSSSNKQNPQLHDCERIEQHIAGALEVIGQGMQVAKVLGDVLSPRTEAAPAKAWTSRDDLLRANTSSYTSAHNSWQGPAHKLPRKDCGCQRPQICVKTPSTSVLEKKRGQKNADIYTAGRENIRQTANRNGGKPLVTASKMLPKEKVTNDQSNFWGDSKDRKFCCSSTVTKQSPLLKGQKKKPNTQHNKICESGVQKCLHCQVPIRKVNKSALMPCGHGFCQRCLTGQTPPKCPKCDLKCEAN